MKGAGRALDLGLAGLAAVQLGAAAYLVPAGDRVSLPDGAPLGPLCPLRLLFAVECPLCGMTRSLVALAHGDLGAALRYHPAGPLLCAAMAAFVGLALAAALGRTRPLVERPGTAILFEAVVLVSLVMGVFRMVRS